MEPFSKCYGLDRGTPIDRVWLEQFLSAHAEDIRGDVLEVRDPSYTRAFGGAAVCRSGVVDIDPSNPMANIVADLGQRDSLPAGEFSCFILTQTLQLIPDLEAAIANAWRALRPGGVLLASVPTVAKVDPDSPHDLWRMTPEGLSQVVSRSRPWAEVSVVGYGNMLTAMALLMGVAAEELRPAELRSHDPAFPVIACARARKPTAIAG